MEVVAGQEQLGVLRLGELQEPYVVVEDGKLREVFVAAENSDQDVAVIVVRLVEVVVRTYLR